MIFIGKLTIVPKHTLCYEASLPLRTYAVTSSKMKGIIVDIFTSDEPYYSSCRYNLATVLPSEGLFFVFEEDLT